MKRIVLAAIIISLFSCKKENIRETISLKVLSQAGENQTELLRVLQHYEENADTLKLKAAQFLIGNMLYHFSYISDKSLLYYNAIDSALSTAKYDIYTQPDLIDSLYNIYNPFNINTRMDLQTLSSDFIIQNIDEAFELWKTSPWCQHLDFDDFCEYILPYRLKDGYLIEDRKAIQNVLIDSELQGYLNLFQYSSEMQYSAFWACMAINQKLKELNTDHALNNSESIYKISTRAKIFFGNCSEYAIITATVMRSLGIPVGIDFTPQWPFRSMGHTWNVLLTNSGKSLSFGGADTNPDVLHKPDAKMAKVYRCTYAINPEVVRLLQAEKYVPKTFNNPHIKDVTTEYMKTSSVSVPIQGKKKHQYAYLAVFNNQKWIPVCFGKQQDSNHFLFENIGRDIVYMPIYYENGKIIPFSDPFILDMKGKVQYLKPNLLQTQDVTLYRKYYLSERMFKYAGRCVGAVIEASNQKDFIEADTLYTITKFTLVTDSIKISTDKKYRYWRYMALPKTWCNIAELEFKYKDKSLVGDVIGTDGVYDSLSPGTDKYTVFDKDPLTFFDAPQDVEYAWVGMDFKEPVSIDKIVYTPRNDDNNIRIGDLYELFYWNNGQWISLGTQEAAEIKLYYKSVPSNALLLLKDLSRGKEERIFTYENDLQCWW